MNTSKVISGRSNLVLISVLITIIIIVFSTVSFLYVVNDIQKLTNYINNSGSIRGGIQRITKLYLLNKNINESIQIIDEKMSALSDFVASQNDIFIETDKNDLLRLVHSWLSLIHI